MSDFLQTSGRSFRLSVILALSCIIATPLVGQPCNPGGPTIVPAGLVFNQTWTEAGSPYMVNGNINVSNLTINPCVQVQCAPGVSITVITTITAIGAPGRPVIFTGQGGGNWAGLVFNNVPGGTLQYCRIQNSHSRAITITDSCPIISDCVIDNNSIAGSNGGGVYASLSTCDLHIQRCEILNNWSGVNGGGIYASNSNGFKLYLEQCTIEGNSCSGNAPRYGGGVSVSGDIEMHSCLVRSNGCSTTYGGSYCSVTSRGGGVHIDGSAIILNCIVTGNSVSSLGCPGGPSTYANSSGGGISLSGNSGLLRNSVLCCNNITASAYGGSSKSGGGIYVHSGVTITMENCTVAGNSQDGVSVNSGGVASLLNSIVYQNSTGFTSTQVSASATASYCDIGGVGVFPGTGNINQNPAFAGPGTEYADFVIVPGSPCMDAGDPSPAFDDVCSPPSHIFGAAGVRNDMGAHGGPGACLFMPPARSVCGGRQYGNLLGGANVLVLSYTPLLNPATSGVLSVTGATPGSLGVLAANIVAQNVSAQGLTVLVDLDPVSLLVVPVPYDMAGSISATVDIQVPLAVGIPIYIQAAEFPPPGSANIYLSNGLQMLVGF